MERGGDTQWGVVSVPASEGLDSKAVTQAGREKAQNCCAFMWEVSNSEKTAELCECFTTGMCPGAKQQAWENSHHTWASI